VFFALLGLVWCGFISFPTANSTPCATAGCALFRDSRIAGVSLWWVGGAFFFVLAILALRGQRAFARLLALLALFLDAILLIIMFFTAACLDCLVVAALIGLCFYSLRPTNNGWFLEDAAPSLLLPIWLGLFVGNCAVVINEQLPHYTLGDPAKSEIRLYFSPSCPACRDAINTLGKNAQLYPVMEREGDFEAIVRFETLLESGLPPDKALSQSLDSATPTPPISVARQALLYVQLLRNKASVLKQGFRALPLIEINGMPNAKTVSPAPDPAEKQTRPAPSDAQDQMPGPDQTLPEQNATIPDDGVFDQPETRPGAPAPGQTEVPDFLNQADNLGQCKSGSTTPCP
jgi:hypothetical protein